MSKKRKGTRSSLANILEDEEERTGGEVVEIKEVEHFEFGSAESHRRAVPTSQQNSKRFKNLKKKLKSFKGNYAIKSRKLIAMNQRKDLLGDSLRSSVDDIIEHLLNYPENKEFIFSLIELNLDTKELNEDITKYQNLINDIEEKHRDIERRQMEVSSYIDATITEDYLKIDIPDFTPSINENEQKDNNSFDFWNLANLFNTDK